MSIALSVRAPRIVRGHLEATYLDVVERSLLDDVVLMASEITTNAVVHSGRPTGDPLTLTAHIGDCAMRVEITDGGDGVAVLTPRSLAPPSGLGFVETLADRWGSHLSGSFHVWFEIDIDRSGTIVRSRKASLTPGVRDA